MLSSSLNTFLKFVKVKKPKNVFNNLNIERFLETFYISQPIKIDDTLLENGIIANTVVEINPKQSSGYYSKTTIKYSRINLMDLNNIEIIYSGENSIFQILNKINEHVKELYSYRENSTGEIIPLEIDSDDIENIPLNNNNLDFELKALENSYLFFGQCKIILKHE